MRITGAADPRQKFEKLYPVNYPKEDLQLAMEGYSSYGNQIGVPAGYVRRYTI